MTTQINLGGGVSVDLETLLTTRLLLQANSGGGKSRTLRKLAEELFGKVRLFIIDPDDELFTLREKFGFVIVGEGGDLPATIETAPLLAERLLEMDASAVFGLYEAFRKRPGDRRIWVRKFLDSLMDLPKKLWKPLVVIVDEAHKFCPQENPKAGSQSEREAIMGCKDAMISLATNGRKRGFCAVFATQRLAKLDKDASAELLNRLVGLTFEDVDVDRAMELMSVSRDERPTFKREIKTLAPGHFFALGRAISKERKLFKVGSIKTTHPEPGSQAAMAAPPPPPEKVKALIAKLGDLPKEVANKSKTEGELRLEVHQLKKQVAQLSAKKDWTVEKKVEVEKRVEIPVIKDSQIKQLEKSVDRLVAACGKTGTLADQIKEILMKSFEREFSKRKDPVFSSVRPPIRDGARVNDVITTMVGGGPKLKIGKVKVETMTSPDDFELTTPQKKILTTLAEFAALDRHEIPRTWVAARSGASPRSSSFHNNLSSLRAKKYIDYVNGGDVKLDIAGVDWTTANVQLDVPVTTEEIVESCLKLLSQPQADIFKYLYHCGENPATREQMAADIGVSARSSSFHNNLSSLRSAGMIEKRRDQLEKVSGWIFVS